MVQISKICHYWYGRYDRVTEIMVKIAVISAPDSKAQVEAHHQTYLEIANGPVTGSALRTSPYTNILSGGEITSPAEMCATQECICNEHHLNTNAFGV